MGKLNYFVEIDPNDFENFHINENKIIIILHGLGSSFWFT